MKRALIGLFPSTAARARPRLISALEAALPVRILAGQDGDGSTLDGVIVVGSDTALIERMRALGVPVLVLAHESSYSRRRVVTFTAEDKLDPRLRRRSLADEMADVQPVSVGNGEVTLAEVAGKPIWVSSVDHGRPLLQQASLAPSELDDGEVLRDLMRAGKFLSLLPLIHFLRIVAGKSAWRPPPLRAAFLFDDPNLHWTSYGHIRYQDLVRAAELYGYHVAMAMIPLDGWFAHRAAVRLFREHPSALSLVVHGNDHVRHELGRPLGAEGARALLAQALRRVTALERRTGLSVGRVMTAPHGVCSLEVAEALVESQFEALCISRPYPWLSRPPTDELLAGWGSADVVAGGLPVLSRLHFDQARDEVVIRAFLDQPIILYGHHQDLRHGLDSLGDLARDVNGLGEIEWSPLSAIAESSFETRRDGAVLAVRLLSRRARLHVPEGVEAIAVELAVSGPQAIAARLEARRADGSVIHTFGTGDGAAVLDVTQLDGVLELTTLPRRADRDLGLEPSWRPWPIVRRGMAEARDRLLPLAHRRGSADRKPTTIDQSEASTPN